MTFYYSKTTSGFYDSSFRLASDTTPSDALKPIMPPDAVAITDAAYAALLAAQSVGKIIQADANGNPEAVNPPAPSAAQIAVAAGLAVIAAGIQITSTSTPALDGDYDLDLNSLLMITGAVSYCLLKNAFPGGASTLTFFDASGAPHVFSTVAEFELFAEAVASFVAPIQDYINSGGTTGALPTSNAVTIA